MGVGDEPDPKSVRAPHFYPDQSTRRLARRPSELYAQIELGKAYVLSGEHDKALAWLSELHRKVPDQPDVQHLIPYFWPYSTVSRAVATHEGSRRP
jgi:hypothetical protein